MDITSHPYLIIGIAAALIAVVGMIRDRKHARRKNLDRVSLVPWGMVSVIALFVAIISFSLALHLGG